VVKGVSAAVAAAVCLSLAFVIARQAAVGLSMPYDMDHFREVAAAQALADGKGLVDPYYAGETLWYNPLLATTVALISKVSGLDVPTAYVQAGPWLTALAQLTFFAMAARLVGAWAAAIALAALIFGPPHDVPSWATPAVTVWAFPSTVASAFFYIALIVCWVAMGRRSPRWWIAAGGALGIVFLAHSAPAVILGLCAVAAAFIVGPGTDAQTADAARSEPPSLRDRLVAVAVLMATALIVSLPLVYSIVGRYHLHIVNHESLDFLWGPLELARLPTVLREGLLSWRGALQIIGVGVLITRASRDRGARLVLYWLAAALLLLGYGYFQQIVGVERARPFLPPHHFFFYVEAVGHVLTGVGAWAVVAGVIGALARRSPSWLARAEPVVSTLAGAGVVAWVVTANYHAFAMRADFQEYRREAVGYTDEFARTQVLSRLRTETPANAIVLASDLNSYYRVAPAGRFVVSIPAVQSNPYVTQGGRDADQEVMLQALLRRDFGTFNQLADKYGVTNVLLGPDEAAQLDAGGPVLTELREMSRAGGYVILARRKSLRP
jgi:hypothetical protein